MSARLPVASSRAAHIPAKLTARRILRLLALAAIALMLVTIAASAYMRLSAAGLSCADWPACYGRIAHEAMPTAGIGIARAAHRVAVSGVAILMLSLVHLSIVARPRRAASIALSVSGLAVVIGLAVVGIVTSGRVTDTPPLPAVALANLLGGFVLLALLVALATSSRIRDEPVFVAAWVRALAFAALAIVAVQAVLGAFVSVRFAALACPSFPLCGANASSGSLPAMLDPFAALTVDASNTIVRSPALAALHWAHRVGAHAVLLVAVALAIGFARARRRVLAAAVIVPVIVELALGATSVVRGLPLFVVLAHNLVAALLLATLAAINVRLRTTGGNRAAA